MRWRREGERELDFIPSVFEVKRVGGRRGLPAGGQFQPQRPRGVGAGGGDLDHRRLAGVGGQQRHLVGKRERDGGDNREGPAGLRGGGGRNDLDRLVAHAQSLAGDFKNKFDGEGRWVNRAPDELSVGDHAHAGGALRAQPIRLTRWG